MRTLITSMICTATVMVGLTAVATPAAAQRDATRLAGDDRFATAAAISRAEHPDGADTVWVANGLTFADALTAGVAAARDGVPVLLTGQQTLPDATAAELARLAPSTVMVAGGPAAIADDLVDLVQAAAGGARVERVWGADRDGTAAAISQQTFPDGADVAFLATGSAFADALAGGVPAALSGGPILLTRSTSLSDATADELRRLAPSRLVVLGGTAAVSQAVVDLAVGVVAGQATPPTVERLAGPDRIATAVAISAATFPDPVDTVVVATGAQFPDALAGVPLAHDRGAPILLLPGQSATRQTPSVPQLVLDEITRLDPSQILVLGGPASISDAQLQQVLGGESVLDPAGEDEDEDGGDDGVTTPADPAAGTWRFSPTDLMVQPGDPARTAQVVHLDAAGVLTGRAPPSGTVIDVVGDTDDIAVTTTGPGAVSVTATGIGSMLVTATIPGADSPATLTISSVGLAEDVVPVVDDQVLFPPPSLPRGTDVSSAQVPGITDSGPGPFTWDEVRARIHVQTDGTDVLDPDARLPFVLTAPAPPTGTLLVGIQGSGLIGRIVEPPGLPTITRGGYSLVSIELVPLTDVFTDLDIDITTDMLAAAGVNAATEQDLVCQADPSIRPDTCDDSASTQQRSGGPAFSQATPQPEPRCTGGTGGSPIEVKLNETKVTGPELFSDIKMIVTNGVLQSANFVVGFDISAKSGMEVKAQGNLTAELTCKITDIGTFPLPVVPPPLAAVLTMQLDLDLNLVAGVKVAGGPTMTLGYGCTAALKVRVGFRLQGNGDVLNKSESDRSGSCEPTFEVLDGVSGVGIAAEAEAGVGIVVAGPLQAQIGGKLTDAIGDWVGYEDLGAVNLLQISAGPKLTAKWQNTSTVLQSGASESNITARFVGTVGLPEGPFEWLLTKLTGQDKGVSLTIGELNLALGTLFRPANGTSWTATVQGRTATSGVVDVRPDEDLVVSATLAYPPVTLSLFDADVTGADVYVSTDDGDSWTEVPAWSAAMSATGPLKVGGTLPVTTQICDEVLPDFTAHKVRIVSSQDMIGLLPTSGHAATLDVRCVDGDLTFSEDEVLFGISDRDDPQQVQIRAEKMPRQEWRIVGESGAIPAWLTVSETSGFLPDEASATVDLELLGDCGDLTTTQHTTLRLELVDPTVPDPPTDTLPVTLECADLTFQPNAVTIQPAGSATVRLIGPALSEADSWTATASGVQASPTSGSVAADEEVDERIVVRDTEPLPPVNVCTGAREGLPERSATVTATSPLRGTTTLDVTIAELPEKPPGNDRCADDPPERDRPLPCVTCGRGSGGWGDPHIVSVDGLRWDAMSRGEHVMLEPLPGEDAPRVHAHFARWTPSEPGSPTAITAVAVEVEGQLVEFHAGADDEVLVNGEPVEIGVAEVIGIGPDTTVSRNDRGELTVVGPGLGLTSTLFEQGSRAWMDAWVYTTDGLPVHGLLGLPDGSAGNDLRLPDGSTVSTSFVQTRTGGIVLAEAWRIFDPAQTLFSSPPAGFGDSSEALGVPSPGTVQDAVPDAEDLMAQVGDVCTSDGGDAQVLALALEIAARGGTVDDLTELAGALCSYTVRGFVVAGADGARAPGVLVTVEPDTDALSGCTVRSDDDGYYRCDMVPTFAATPGGSVVPITATVTAASDLATATATFPELVPVGRGDVENVDLQIPEPLRSLQIGGSVLADGAFIDHEVPLRLTAVDADGDEVFSHLLMADPDPTSGIYHVGTQLPPDAVSITVQPEVPGMDGFTLDPIPDGQTVRNLDLPFPILLRGLIAIGDQPARRSANIVIEAFDGAERLDRGFVRIASGLDGMFEMPLAAPAAADRVVLSGRIGGVRNVVELDLSETGTFDLDLGVTIVDLSGEVLVGGSPTDLPVSMRPTDGSLEVTFDGAGAYTGVAHLPRTADQVGLDVTIGGVPTSASLDGLTPGRLTRTLDVALPQLVVSGTLAINGVGVGPRMIVADMRDGDDATVLTRTMVATPATDGSYTVTSPIPADATSVEVSTPGIDPVTVEVVGDVVTAELSGYEGGDLPSIVQTVAGTGEDCYDYPACRHVDAVADEVDVVPHAIEVADDGTIYMADISGVIFEITTDGRITHIGGYAEQVADDAGVCSFYSERWSQPSRNPNAVCLEAEPIDGLLVEFDDIEDLALMPDGDLLVVDPWSQRILRLDPDTSLMTVFAGRGTYCDDGTTCGDGGPAVDADVQPNFVAAAPDGTVYTSTSQVTIRRIAPDGTITTYAGDRDEPSCGDGQCGDGGPAADATLGTGYAPLATGPGGTLTLVDYTGWDPIIRQIDGDGIITSIAGHQAPDDFSYDDEWYYGDNTGTPAAEMVFYNCIEGVDVGPDGSIYLPFCEWDSIYRITPDLVVERIVGVGPSARSHYSQGNTGVVGPGAPGNQTETISPTDVAVGPDGGIVWAEGWWIGFDHFVRRLVDEGG